MSMLNQIRDSLKKRDAVELADALKILISESPKTWSGEVHRLGGIPHPQTSASDDTIALLATAFDQLEKNGAIHAEAMHQSQDFLRLLVDYRERYLSTQRVLESSRFLDDKQAVRLWRLASHVEDQYHRCIQKSLEAAIATPRFTTAHVVQSALSDNAGTRHNLQEIWEGLTESTELAIRFLLRRDGIQSLDDPSALHSSYCDPHFLRLLQLAVRWRGLNLTYDNLRYGDWSAELESVEDASGVRHTVESQCPTDVADLVRKHASYIRHQLYTVEMTRPSFELLHHFSDRPANIVEIARSIRLPAVGHLWDGYLDLEALRRAASSAAFPIEVKVAIDAWHLRQWVKKLRINSRYGSIEWEQWFNAQNVLRIVASALMESIKTHLREDDDGSLGRIIRCSNQRLADLVCAGSGLTNEDSVRAIDSIVFDPERRGVDWWGMPLIPLRENEVIIVPSVLVTSDPIRVLEGAVRRDSPQVAQRSEAFNRYVLEPFAEVGAKIAMGFTIDGFDGRQVEFDGIIWWEQKLILVEAKCLRSLEGPHDDWRGSGEIDSAVRQLVRRRSSVQIDWGQIKSRLSTWDLPSDPPSQENVITIAVTNVLRFTTLQKEGVFVTDALCLRRFFSRDPFVYVCAPGGGRRPIGRVRVRDEPTAEELSSYLAWPPHLAWIFEGLAAQWHWVLSLGDDIPIRFVTAAFKGDPESAEQN